MTTKTTVSINPEMLTRAHEFNFYARLLATCQGESISAKMMAKARQASPRVLEILEKSPIVPGKLHDPANWGDALSQSYRELARAFVDSLRHVGVFDAMSAAFVPVPMRTRIRVVTSGAVGGEIFETNTKVISRLTLNGTTLEPRKAVATMVITDELARNVHPGALELFSRELRNAVAASSDSMFLQHVVDSVGGADVGGTGGTTAADDADDIANALNAIDGSSRSRYFAVISADTAKQYAMHAVISTAFASMSPQGGQAFGVQFLVSDQLPSGVHMVMVDASQVAADVGSVLLDGSREADVKLDNESSDGAGELVSTWQAGLRALRAERLFGFELLRATGAAVVTENASV